MGWLKDLADMWRTPPDYMEMERLRAENDNMRERLIQATRLFEDKWRKGDGAPEELVHQAKKLAVSISPDVAGGEAKRHRVYSQLIKQYPGVRKRILALAIELAMDDTVK